MFVPKSNSVTNLVHYNPKFIAVLSHRNPLAPIPLPSNVGTAATRGVNRRYIIQSKSVSQLLTVSKKGEETPENHQAYREGHFDYQYGDGFSLYIAGHVCMD